MAKTETVQQAAPQLDLSAFLAQAKADPGILAKMLLQMDKAGVSLSAVQKAHATLRKSGEIKAKGRGKAPQDDPLRQEVIAYLNHAGFASTMLKIVEATKEATSFLVTLNDKYQVNFIKKVKRVKKEKIAATPEAVEQKEAEFAEPAIA